MSDSDEMLMRALEGAIGEPTPVGLAERCEGLLTWLDADSELAALLDQPVAEAAGTRGSPDAPTVLEFVVDAAGVTVEVDVSAGMLAGRVLGAAVDEITARPVAGEPVTASVDRFGWFTFTDPPSGTVRLEVELADRRRIRTDWFVSPT